MVRVEAGKSQRDWDAPTQLCLCKQGSWKWLVASPDLAPPHPTPPPYENQVTQCSTACPCVWNKVVDCLFERREASAKHPAFKIQSSVPALQPLNPPKLYFHRLGHPPVHQPQPLPAPPLNIKTVLRGSFFFPAVRLHPFLLKPAGGEVPVQHHYFLMLAYILKIGGVLCPFG